MAGIEEDYEVIVIGAGIAGASLAYFLTQRGIARVLVVERESQPAYHATGRSAASLVEIDLNPTVQDLKILGGAFLRNPPPGFSESSLLEQRGVLVLLDDARWQSLNEGFEDLRTRGMPLRMINAESANRLVDGQLELRHFVGAAFLPYDGFIDVHELLSAYMAHARRAGAAFRFEVDAVPEIAAGRCIGVRVGDRTIRAGVVVDAAGAWAGEVARYADATPVEMVAKRRCMAVLEVPQHHDLRHWPMVWSDDSRVYFRDDAGRLMMCPMDELAMPPCDASWDEEAIAAGIERMCELAPQLRPRAVLHRWAGLRTFAPDNVPVVGYDPRRQNFFWLAGQGGCGIETSGAVGALAADLLIDYKTLRFDAAKLAPGRFGS